MPMLNWNINHKEKENVLHIQISFRQKDNDETSWKEQGQQYISKETTNQQRWWEHERIIST
jgi:hypothetical protein